MFGSDSRWMIDWNGFMSSSVNGASPSSTRHRFRADLDDLAVRLLPDLLERARDPVDGPDRDRLDGRRRDSLVDGRHRPVDIATPGLGDRADVGDGVVLDLVSDGAAQLLTLRTDRRRRPDIGAGRHVREVGRERDERAGAGRPAAAGRDPDDRGQRRLEQRRHDALRGVEAATRGVELHDEGGRSVGRGPSDALLDVAGHDVVDHTGGGQHVDRRAPVGGPDGVHRPAGGGYHQPGKPGGDEQSTEVLRRADHPWGRDHQDRSSALSRAPSDVAPERADRTNEGPARSVSDRPVVAARVVGYMIPTT